MDVEEKLVTDSLELVDDYVVPSYKEALPPVQSSIHPWRRILIWTGAGLALLVIGVLVVLLTHKTPAKTTTSNVVVNTQTLSAGTLQKIEQHTTANGVNEQLTISPSTLFKSDASVQGDTSLAKNAQIGGNLTVSGSVNIGSNLAVTGLISAPSLSVSSLNVKSLRLGGDFTFAGHLLPSGPAPTIASGQATGGGSVSIDGTDAAGTVTITTGSGGVNGGELATITFHTAYGTNARVQLTPLNAASAALQTYASQSSKFFTIETANTLSAGTVYMFNYLITQ